MGAFRQRTATGGGWVAGVAVSWLLLAATAGAGTRTHAVRLSPWETAVKARAEFEARGAHTRVEYARVMDGFRAIYHGDPADEHAARAVQQVAELLAEEGRELDDRKALHDAARQWEFLAKSYPSATGSPAALGKALELLGPTGAADAMEAKKVRAELLEEYPKSAAAREAGNRVKGIGNRTKGESLDARAASEVKGQPRNAGISPLSETVMPSRSGRDDGAVGGAEVMAIRHWSTPTYTRVAIDLGPDAGDGVRYEATRVVHPDRIFFDLHDTKLAAGLVNKSFTVTDGFLTRIRAAQAAGDVTRVVLDVQAVGEYSAFLLPNPERLIIDIHGRTGNREQGVATPASQDRSPGTPVATPASQDRSPGTPVASRNAGAPIVRERALGGAGVSSLPAMPVTDGSAGAGWTSRVSDGRATGAARVVIPSQPTVAKPVPNAEAQSSEANDSEVAAVSGQPGKVEATRRPTSKPVTESVAGAGEHYQRPKRAGAAVGSTGSAANPVAAAVPTADGETLMRALGLKIGRIVIDAGHGGHDSGTLGAGGIEEKDVVLDVALRLGKLLHDRLGAQIVYTRADDTFIPLETRTAIANKAQADLFLSVHANSSPDASARGVEVYYLNFTSDADAMNVAARENAVSTQSVHELSDLVKKIALKDKIDESKELATDVDASLYAGLARGNDGLKDRGVKKAPFVVLIGANMPSILAEISFVTNPDDAEQLQRPEYRERVAESLCKGVERYAAGINGAKPKVVERAAR